MFTAVRGYYLDVAYEKSVRFIERVIEMHPDLWHTYARDPAQFAAQLREYVLYSPNTGLYLLDDEGQVLASAGEPRAFGRGFKVDLSPVKAALDTQSDAPVISDDPDHEQKTCLVAARPVKRGDQTMGWLYVVARSANLGSSTPELMRSYAVRTAVTVSLMTLALGVLLTISMIAVLTRPLIELTRVVENVKDSGFAESLCGSIVPNCGRDDEVGRLSRAFRESFERLNLEAQRVKDIDSKRREMVASVSHDLRTPLTALIGLLDTVRMKGAELSPQEQREYLARAKQNAQHLKRLTDALNELSRLDNPEFKTHTEPIAIGELADDVVQRFVASAERAGLQLELDYPDGLPLAPVDAALIERALANLLDNALRVTPRGGRVRVSVLRVRAADFGWR